MYREAKVQLHTFLTAASEVNYKLHAPVALPLLYVPPTNVENRESIPDY
jgi:hypothetical protein